MTGLPAPSSCNDVNPPVTPVASTVVNVGDAVHVGLLQCANRKSPFVASR